MMKAKQPQQQSRETEENLMTPAEVAALFRVSPKTVARWSRSGRLTAVKTLGGHRRFHTSEVDRLREEAEMIESE